MKNFIAYIKAPFNKLVSKYICYDVSRSFRKLAHELAIQSGNRKLDCDTIRAIYHEINRKDKIVKQLENGELEFEDVKTIILGYIYKNHSYNTLLDAHAKSKSEQLGLDVKDILKLNRENRNIKRIIDRLAESKANSKKQRNSRPVTLDELQTLYFANDENTKILKSYLAVVKEDNSVSPELFMKAVFKGIRPDTFANVLKVLAINKLKIPDKTLLELFDDKINILKTIKILSEAKSASVETVTKLYPDLSAEASENFANVYTIEGKNRLKKSISETILKMNLLLDPAEIYMSLIRSEGNGFKINLETINNYIKYDFEPDVNQISNVFRYARNKGIRIEYEQLATLARQEVDIKALIDAEIKSRTHETKNSI